MKNWIIDINCDVGEGIGNEAEILPLISSCSIACGGHAGNRNSMTEVIKLARKYKVKIGAHPSYPDRKNFGRLTPDISHDELRGSLRDQLDLFLAILDKEEGNLHHIKPHGALYNDLVKSSDLSETFLKALNNVPKEVIIYAPWRSVIARKAIEQGYQVNYEAFGDRNYHDDLSLVSRKKPNALKEDPAEVLEHIVRMVKEKRVLTVEGNIVNIQAATYCIHGDTPSAKEILVYLSKNLGQHNIKIDR